MFSAECGQIRELSSNTTLLPERNIDLSSSYSSSYEDISSVWCSSNSDSSPNAHLTFTEPLYLLYFVARGDHTYNNYVTNFSLNYRMPSGESETYTNVDGNSVSNYGYTHVICLLCML